MVIEKRLIWDERINKRDPFGFCPGADCLS